MGVAGDLNGDGRLDIIASGLGEQNDSGVVRTFAGNDLYLNASNATPNVGSTLALTTTGAKANATGALVLTAINGVATFVVLDIGNLGPDGERVFSSPIPPLASGVSFALQAFAEGFPGVADSDVVTIAVP